MRTYRPLALSPVTSSTPPFPALLVCTVVHTPVGELLTCTSYSLLNAASQSRTTRLIVRVAPRSTYTHWLSLNELDQRLYASPSMALAAAYVDDSFDELTAVVGMSCTNPAQEAFASPNT